MPGLMFFNVLQQTYLKVFIFISRTLTFWLFYEILRVAEEVQYVCFGVWNIEEVSSVKKMCDGSIELDLCEKFFDSQAHFFFFFH